MGVGWVLFPNFPSHFSQHALTSLFVTFSKRIFSNLSCSHWTPVCKVSTLIDVSKALMQKRGYWLYGLAGHCHGHCTQNKTCSCGIAIDCASQRGCEVLVGHESSRKPAGRGRELHLTSLLKPSGFDFSAWYHHVRDQAMFEMRHQLLGNLLL